MWLAALASVDDDVGAAYVAFGEASLQAVARSVRSLRRTNDMGVILGTDAAGLAWARATAPLLFDHVLEVCRARAEAETIDAAVELFRKGGVVFFRRPAAVCGSLRSLARPGASTDVLARSNGSSLALCPGSLLAEEFSATTSSAVPALPNQLLRDDRTALEAPATFVHLPKASGNSVKQFFVKDRLLRHRSRSGSGGRRRRPAKEIARSLHIDTRKDWDDTQRRRRRHRDAAPVSAVVSGDTETHPLVLYGAYSFGACRAPCAYYAIFRDPVARVASEFKFCRETIAFRDQCCGGPYGVRTARTIGTVDRWARHRGNFMLEHFLGFSPADWVPIERNGTRGYVPWRKRDFETRVNPIETRRRREGPANGADLDVVLANLETWFAVVGLTERYEESMALFSYVLTGRVVSATEARSVHTHNQGGSSSSSKKRQGPLLSPDVLADVRSALHLDIQLYDAATRLFDRQVAAFRAKGLTFID